MRNFNLTWSKAFAALLILLSVVGAENACAAQEALKQENSDAFYRRILSLPKAVLYEEPDVQSPKVIEEVPAFSVFYIFGEKNIDGVDWLEIGQKPVGGGAGWVNMDNTEAWRSMLVMQYAPRGQRNRVPFFDDSNKLRDIVESYNLDDIRSLTASELPEDVSGSLGLLAREPEAAVLAEDKPYLMPIFEFEFSEFGNSTIEPTTLVSVGGLNLGSGLGGAGAGGEGEGEGEGTPQGGVPQAPSLEDFRIGISFVIDTTQSMGPYIEKTRNIVRSVYDRLEADGTIDKVRFSLVGYRDDTSYNPDIEYVTKIFQDFDANATPDSVLKNLEKVTPARVPTEGWNEDVWAGVMTAINDLSWEQNNLSARFIIIVSDAGARSGSDDRAAYHDATELYVAEAARQKNIVLLPIHLKTPEAERAGNIGIAEHQYRGIGETGDSSVNKYVGIDAGDVADFARQLTDASNMIASTLRQTANNQRVEDPGPRPEQNDQNEETPEEMSDEAPETDLGRFLVNEVFRAQLEYIGREGEETAPSFYRAWASDRDLLSPQFDALDPSVFLTRTQLSGLAQSLGDLVARAKAADLEPDTFFDLLQSLAATTSMDPTREGQAGEFSNLADSGLLPSFLEELPYHSDVLMVDRRNWQSRGATGRDEFIAVLEQKISIYQLINDSPDRWLELGAGGSALQVYPVPLLYLP